MGEKKGNDFRWKRGTKVSRKKEKMMVIINNREREREKEGSIEKPYNTLGFF